MRIIAGSARRISLEVADGTSTRPFLEMARGALFNSLGGRVAEAAVLDLFAGSGALGLEALSRGAASAVFVESDARAFAALERNIVKCGMTRRARPIRRDVDGALTGLAETFDLIFVDPPFANLDGWRPGGAAEKTMRAIAGLLAPDGVAVFRLEENRRTEAPPAWPGLVLASDKKYGRSRVCRYVREAATEGEA